MPGRKRRNAAPRLYTLGASRKTVRDFMAAVDALPEQLDELRALCLELRRLAAPKRKERPKVIGPPTSAGERCSDCGGVDAHSYDCPHADLPNTPPICARTVAGGA